MARRLITAGTAAALVEELADASPLLTFFDMPAPADVLFNVVPLDSPLPAESLLAAPDRLLPPDNDDVWLVRADVPLFREDVLLVSEEVPPDNDDVPLVSEVVPDPVPVPVVVVVVVSDGVSTGFVVPFVPLPPEPFPPEPFPPEPSPPGFTFVSLSINASSPLSAAFRLLQSSFRNTGCVPVPEEIASIIGTNT